MPTHDALATAALAESVRRPAYFGYFDFAGDPLRATTFGADVPFSGTGDADLDGFTFQAINGRMIDIGEVVNQRGGSDTLTLTLSGLKTIDPALLAIIYDRTKWWRRVGRLWKLEYNEALSPQGAAVGYYTGYMVGCEVIPTPTSQTIQIKLENYLVLLSGASHRNYGRQADLDPADTSASATIGAANGVKAGPGAGAGAGGAFARLVAGRVLTKLL